MRVAYQPFNGDIQVWYRCKDENFERERLQFPKSSQYIDRPRGVLMVEDSNKKTNV